MFNLLRKRQNKYRQQKQPPPIMFPIVTGSRLPIKKLPKLIEVEPRRAASRMKSMFAIQCSKPSVTKAITGNQIPNILAIGSLTVVETHIARQTSQLHPIPIIKATLKRIEILASATLTA